MYVFVCVCVCVRERERERESEWMYVYIFTQPLRHKQNMTQSQFLSGVKLVWIQKFPSSKLVAEPKLKKLVGPTIYS